MADYSSGSNKSIISKKKKENSTGQNPFQTSSYSENPFVSANQGNPFETNKESSNPFTSNSNTTVTQQKPIQRDVNFTKLSGTSSLDEDRTNAQGNPERINQADSIEGKGPDSFEMAGEVLDTASSIHDEFSDATNEAGEDLFNVPGEIGSVMGIAGGIFSMASGIKGLMDPDTDGFDKAMSVINIASGAGGVAQTITDIVQGEGGQAAPIIGIVNSSLGAIKNAIGVVKQIKKLKDGVEEGTKAQEALALASQITQVGLDIANIVKSIYEIVGTAAPGALEAAVPGLGIVMATIDIIQQGVEIAKAVQNYRTMSGFKDELKIQVKKDYSDVLTSDKSGIFGRFRSNDRTVEPNLTNAMNQEAGDPANAGATANGKTSAREFALARELKKVNRKRIIRGTINISADALTIAGDIATLSGVGAGVGVGLKVGAAGVKMGSKLARFAKQKYRDSGRGDQSKTSGAKHAKRVTNIKFIFQMIKNLQPSDPEKETKAIRIKTYIEATGTSFESFIKHKANPQAAAKLLYSAMKKREAADEVSAE
jgi:hypothetical protein